MEGLLAGLRVVDLLPPEQGMAGRILADLGADVVTPPPPPATSDEPPGQVPTATRARLWAAGKRTVPEAELAPHLAAAHVVLAAAPADGALAAPHAAWVAVTPYGLDGPRARWRASDLTVVAAGGNMYPTGDPDRPPLRCTEPTSAAHTGPETVIAALTAVASGTPQLVDVSMQETFLVASMTGPARFAVDGDRGKRRGAFTGRTRETWRCKDGWVSFGLRGGPARARNLQTLTDLCVADGVATPALTDRDWTTYDHRSVTDEELQAISDVVAAFFARHTMAELYDLAVRTGLMLAPTNSPREILASEQLVARGFFTADREPRTFVRAGPDPALVDRRDPAPAAPSWSASGAYVPGPAGPAGPAGPTAWAGLKMLEFGSGAAGPIVTKYFADHGATVVRVESRTRPDFLRSYTTRRGDLDSSVFFAVLNAGKLGITLNMKHPRAIEVAKRLVSWADVVTDNFAPGAMDRWGLDRAALRAANPTAVLFSACLQGQTGPHRDYPGFGGQGAALSGYTFLTGWPDRAPVGPNGTITDSLAPRFGAACVAAALLHQRRTGTGVDLDLAQVEAAAWTLSPWLAHYAHTGEVVQRAGNRDPRACPHGVFPAAGTDRWVALAVWSDDEWERLAKLIGATDPALATLAGRLARVDAVEELVAGWSRDRSPADAAAALQAEGIDAYPVNDWGDLHADPQLVARRHFVPLEHPVLGTHPYEETGFRLGGSGGGVHRPAPTLGQHTREVLSGILGLTDDEIASLDADGALS